MASGFHNKKQTQSLAEQLTKKTKFNRDQVKALLGIFTQKMNRSDFRDIMHNDFGITDDVLLDRLFRTFDKDQDGFLSRQETIEGFSVYLLGTKQEQIHFCFCVYDMMSSGQLTRDEIYQLLKNALVHTSSDEDREEETKNLVDIAVKLMLDEKKRERRDLIITHEDFRERVMSEGMFMEILGTILPSDDDKKHFLDKLDAPNDSSIGDYKGITTRHYHKGK